LDPCDYAFVAPDLTRICLSRGQIIATAKQEVDFVCFPEGGVISLSDILDDGGRVEIGIVGREGMTDPAVLLGCDRAPYEMAVEVGQHEALLLPADRLYLLCRRSPAAHAVFLRFVQAFMVQIAGTLACNLRDSTQKRLARHLLMYHDRIDGDEIDLIHKHIATMLGVRRATVTDCLHILEGNQAIRNQRGHIVIRDRARLEEIAGESYGAAEALWTDHAVRQIRAPQLEPLLESLSAA